MRWGKKPVQRRGLTLHGTAMRVVCTPPSHRNQLASVQSINHLAYHLVACAAYSSCFANPASTSRQRDRGETAPKGEKPAFID